MPYHPVAVDDVAVVSAAAADIIDEPMDGVKTSVTVSRVTDFIMGIADAVEDTTAPPDSVIPSSVAASASHPSAAASASASHSSVSSCASSTSETGSSCVSSCSSSGSSGSSSDVADLTDVSSHHEASAPASFGSATHDVPSALAPLGAATYDVPPAPASLGAATHVPSVPDTHVS